MAHCRLPTAEPTITWVVLQKHDCCVVVSWACLRAYTLSRPPPRRADAPEVAPRQCGTGSGRDSVWWSPSTEALARFGKRLSRWNCLGRQGQKRRKGPLSFGPAAPLFLLSRSALHFGACRACALRPPIARANRTSSSRKNYTRLRSRHDDHAAEDNDVHCSHARRASETWLIFFLSILMQHKTTPIPLANKHFLPPLPPPETLLPHAANLSLSSFRPPSRARSPRAPSTLQLSRYPPEGTLTGTLHFFGTRSLT